MVAGWLEGVAGWKMSPALRETNGVFISPNHKAAISGVGGLGGGWLITVAMIFNIFSTQKTQLLSPITNLCRLKWLETNLLENRLKNRFQRQFGVYSGIIFHLRFRPFWTRSNPRQAVGSQGIFTLKHLKATAANFANFTQAFCFVSFFSAGVNSRDVRRQLVAGFLSMLWRGALLVWCWKTQLFAKKTHQSKPLGWRISSCLIDLSCSSFKLTPDIGSFSMVLWWPQMAGQNWAHRFPEYPGVLP